MRRLVWVWVVTSACGAEAPPPFSVVTFNSGTTEGLAHDSGPEDGYTSAEAAFSDTYYGDGLAWLRAVEDTRAYFARTRPAVVGFQEIFYAGECPEVPEAARAGFVCETWSPGDATVAQVVLGPDYQVACHPQKNDKCVGVRRDFGQIRGCADDLCLDGLEGAPVVGCGRGARVARARIDRTDGTVLEVVHVHGSSGFSDEDVACRVAQFEQALDFVDGPALVLGDFNTDPARLYDGDASAAKLVRGAAQQGLQFITDSGEDAVPTYGGILNIDHVLGLGFEGTCATGDVTEMTYFDHRPQLCDVRRSETPVTVR